MKIQPTFDEYSESCTPEQANAIDMAGSQDFVDANPDYYCVDENTRQLRLRLLGLPLTRKNLEIVYRELQAEGTIIERPAASESPVSPVSPGLARALDAVGSVMDSSAETIARRSKEEIHAEQADLRKLSPIPSQKFDRSGKRHVVEISPELERLNQQSVAVRKSERGDSRDSARHMALVRSFVGNAHPEIDLWSRNFKALVAEETAKGLPTSFYENWRG
jgi:hypothetical protein